MIAKTDVATSPLAAELRGRIAWYWLPVTALAAALLAYALHHVPPLSGHEAELVAAVIAATVAAIVAAGFAARPSERLLPIVVGAGRGRRVRRAQLSDAGFCAALHAATLDHGFFVGLGHGFLRAYHRTFVASPHAIAFVATVDGVPVGMVSGALRPGAHGRWVFRRRGVRFAVRGLVSVLLRPRTALRFARTRIRRYGGAWRRLRSEPPSITPEVPVAVLHHLAVLPGARGLGIGVELTQAFTRAAVEAGAGAAVLLTTAGEAGAAGFYEQLGWYAHRSVTTRDGREMTAMRRELSWRT